MLKSVSVEDGTVKVYTLFMILYIMEFNEQGNLSV